MMSKRSGFTCLVSTRTLARPPCDILVALALPAQQGLAYLGLTIRPAGSANSLVRKSRPSPPAKVCRHVMGRILVHRQPVISAGQHRPEKLFHVCGLDRVTVGAIA